MENLNGRGIQRACGVSWHCKYKAIASLGGPGMIQKENNCHKIKITDMSRDGLTGKIEWETSLSNGKKTI